MNLSKKVKEELINEQGYNFDSEYWTNDNIVMFKEIMIATENVVKKMDYMRSSTLLKDKKIKDLLNWVKSDIGQEENPKLGKTNTPYRREKLRFLYKIKEMLNL